MIFLFLGGVLCVYLLLRYRFSFWERKGVKYAATSSIFGNISDNLLQRRSMADVISELYNRFSDEPFFGIFTFLTPTLVIRDPELYKQLAVKNSDTFFGHKLFSTGDSSHAWTNNLFVSSIRVWKNVRPSLSPAFTGSKMRGLFTMVTQCSGQWLDAFAEGVTEEVTVVDIKKDVFLRYTIDVIATCIFGLESDSFANKDNEFYVRAAEVGDFGGKKVFPLFGYCLNKYIKKIFKLRVVPAEDEDFFSRVVLETIKMRKEHSIVRPDMVHFLMEAQKGGQKYDDESSLDDTGFATVGESHLGKGGSDIKITDLDIVGHSLLLLVAGSDTPALALNFMAYEVATHKDVQDRLHLELSQAMEECQGQMTYEKLMGLKYLDMVCSESLRKWPPLPLTDRVTTQPYTINHKGRTVHLEKGSIIWVPMMCIHRDPQYYPEPDRFDPERFSDQNRGSINKDHYMPFGAGPRACIGSRLAMLMLKSIMLHVLYNFELLPVEETPNPPELSKRHVFLNSQKPIYLGLRKRPRQL